MRTSVIQTTVPPFECQANGQSRDPASRKAKESSCLQSPTKVPDALRWAFANTPKWRMLNSPHSHTFSNYHIYPATFFCIIFKRISALSRLNIPAWVHTCPQPNHNSVIHLTQFKIAFILPIAHTYFLTQEVLIQVLNSSHQKQLPEHHALTLSSRPFSAGKRGSSSSHSNNQGLPSRTTFYRW